MSAEQPYPYCVMVTPPQGDPVYLGFATLAQAEQVRERLQALKWPLFALGTDVQHGGTPEGVTVMPPVPLEVTDLANVLAVERVVDRRCGPCWPSVAERLIAQEGQGTAGPWLERAEELVDQLENTMDLGHSVGTRVSLERVQVVLSQYVDAAVVDNVLEALRRED